MAYLFHTLCLLAQMVVELSLLTVVTSCNIRQKERKNNEPTNLLSIQKYLRIQLPKLKAQNTNEVNAI